MSEAKPLRFAHVEQKEETPEWIMEAQKSSGSTVTPLTLPEVEVDSIAAAADTGNEIPMQIPDLKLSARPANSNSMRPQSEHPIGQAGTARRQNLLESASATKTAEIMALEARLKEQASAFAMAAAELGVARQEALSALEGDVLQLAIHVAEAIVEQELTDRPELHVSLARAAIDSIEGGTQAELRVGTMAAIVLRQHFGGDTFEVNGVQLRLVEESALSELGCVIDTGTCRIDGRLSQRLSAVRRAFEAERRRRMEEAS